MDRSRREVGAELPDAATKDARSVEIGNKRTGLIPDHGPTNV
jgi:hypothetical protein